MRRLALQQRLIRRGRSALGLVVVAMLNLAFQPCAMAMDMDTDHGCPHCPPEMQHAAHEARQDLAEIATCDVVGVYNVDSRTDKPQAKDPCPDVHVLPAAEPPTPAATEAQRVDGDCGAVPRYSGDPPLNLLYCVFLK